MYEECGAGTVTRLARVFSRQHGFFSTLRVEPLLPRQERKSASSHVMQSCIKHFSKDWKLSITWQINFREIPHSDNHGLSF